MNNNLIEHREIIHHQPRRQNQREWMLEVDMDDLE